MKNVFNLLIFCTVLFLLHSCRKDPAFPIAEKNANCPEMYDIRSRPYINPYKGTISTGSPTPPDHIYPEKYCYWYPVANPRNLYEIAYCRRENGVQSESDMDLFTYNFCTGKATIIAKHVAFSPDWSVKDWIIFTTNDGGYKIKSNGDSLTKLTSVDVFQNNARWNTTGTLFIWSSTKIANENGEIVYTIPHCGSLTGWYDSIHILNIQNGSNEITKMNITNNQSEHLFFKDSNTSFSRYNSIKNEFLGANYIGTTLKRDLIYNLTNNKTTYLSDFTLPSFLKNIYCQLDNKLLMQQILTDTMTGSRTLLNFRSHIAIMNLDGTNERQVMLPE